jgi:hypothetical protein
MKQEFGGLRPCKGTYGRNVKIVCHPRIIYSSTYGCREHYSMVTQFHIATTPASGGQCLSLLDVALVLCATSELYYNPLQLLVLTNCVGILLEILALPPSNSQL